MPCQLEQVHRIRNEGPICDQALADRIPRLHVSLIGDNFYREWDRFAKTEYERLAMEEEGGDDSEMIDAMENWDSEDQDEEGHKNKKKGEDPVAD